MGFALLKACACYLISKESPTSSVDLDDPAVMLSLLKLKAVVGVKGNFNSDGSLKSVDSLAPFATLP